MAPATRKPRATIVNRELVGQAKTLLQELPEKPKEDLSLREAVDHLQEEIKAAMARGYNYEDIAKLLSQQGIKISTLTLKNYVPSGKRQLTKTKTKRTKKLVDESPTTDAPPEATAPVEPETPATPAPAKTRRGRVKTVEATPTTGVEAEPKKRSTRTRKSAAKAIPKTPATSKTSTGRGRKKNTAS